MKLRTAGTLAAVTALAFSACNQPGTSAGPTTGGAAKPAACENKKGTSSTEIHVYSSLPRQGTNTEQTNTLVEQIRNTLDGKKVGNFTIKYTDLDDSSAANNGDWDGAVEQSNANTVAADPDAMVYIGTYNSGAAKLSIPILNAACL
jgi:branched-chain amino acid transport system substrate-binding protein